MGSAHRTYLTPGYREKRELKRLKCHLPVSLILPDGTQLYGTAIDISPEGIAVSGLDVQTLPSNFTLSGLRNESPLEDSPIWVEGDLFGIKLEDCWNKLVWLETEFSQLAKALRPVEE